MKRCKWCREEIIPSRAFAPWRHFTGPFTCKRHPETVAEPADERWERVYATFGRNDFFPGTWVFFVEVRFENQRWTSRHVIAEEELVQYPKSYTHVLDAMVDFIDEMLPEETA